MIYILNSLDELFGKFLIIFQPPEELGFILLSPNPHKMVKHIQTIWIHIQTNIQTHSNNLPTNFLSVFDHFVGLVLKAFLICLQLPFVFFLHRYIFGTLEMYFDFENLLTLWCLVSTKRSHILKQTCSFQLQVWRLQVCLSLRVLLVDTRH